MASTKPTDREGSIIFFLKGDTHKLSTAVQGFLTRQFALPTITVANLFSFLMLETKISPKITSLLESFQMMNYILFVPMGSFDLS
jgi:hypothetical protein